MEVDRVEPLVATEYFNAAAAPPEQAEKDPKRDRMTIGQRFVWRTAQGPVTGLIGENR